jgi:transposase
VFWNTRQVSVWVYAQPVDMRKSFDGLAAVVTERLGRDPLCGDLFVFVGRNRKRAKVLHCRAPDLIPEIPSDFASTADLAGYNSRDT